MTGDWLLPPLLESPYWEWSALVLGLIVGSFANVCIHLLLIGPCFFGTSRGALAATR
jgi:hypothetical protein